MTAVNSGRPGLCMLASNVCMLASNHQASIVQCANGLFFRFVRLLLVYGEFQVDQRRTKVRTTTDERLMMYGMTIDD
jgi:hypothetical protein